MAACPVRIPSPALLAPLARVAASLNATIASTPPSARDVSLDSNSLQVNYARGPLAIQSCAPLVPAPHVINVSNATY